MPEIADGAVFEVAIEGRLFAQQTINTFFYRWSAEVPGTFLPQTEALEQVVAALSGPYQGALSIDWKGYLAHLRDPKTDPVFGSVEQPIPGWAGQFEGPAAPPSVAVVLTRTSSTPGRRNRGRIYLPGIPKEWCVDGLLSPAGVLAVSPLASFMTEDIDAADPEGFLHSVIWSRVNQNYTDITLIKLRSILRSQRRREIGVGA
jgi:hypothetical protein